MEHFEDQIEELLANDSFVRWIEGDASVGEASEWRNWLHSDQIHKKLVEEAKTLHFSIQFKQSKRPDMETELRKLGHSIDALGSMKRQRKVPLPLAYKHREYYMHVAAAVALLVAVLTAVSILYYEPAEQSEAGLSYLTTHTEYGQKKVLSFSDGSTITLNANSSLRYPENYSDEDLEVWLEGEAYFDIVRKTGEERRTFSVHTSDGKIEVLGTKFNVNTFLKGTEVVLEQGKVRVDLSDTLSQRVIRTHFMKPGELSHMEAGTESLEVRQIQPDVYTSWTQDRLIFNRTPLVQVARRIEDIYGVQFPISDLQDRQTLVSGSVPNDNLPVLLNALEKILEQPIHNAKGTIHLGTVPADSQE